MEIDNNTTVTSPEVGEATLPEEFKKEAGKKALSVWYLLAMVEKNSAELRNKYMPGYTEICDKAATEGLLEGVGQLADMDSAKRITKELMSETASNSELHFLLGGEQKSLNAFKAPKDKKALPAAEVTYMQAVICKQKTKIAGMKAQIVADNKSVAQELNSEKAEGEFAKLIGIQGDVLC